VVHRIIGRRPSPALVISLVALFVALGGTGYAALAIPKNSVGSPQIVNHSVRTADLSRKAVAALRGDRGPSGPAGPQGPAGERGPAGEKGAAGAAGTARAYAEVDNSTPSFVTARTKNFTAVTRVDDGVYCLTPAAGIDPRAVAASTAEDFGLSDSDGFVMVVGTGSDCSAGQFEVETDDLYGDATNDIAFDLIVP
jgi:hypothetical protein